MTDSRPRHRQPNEKVMQGFEVVPCIGLWLHHVQKGSHIDWYEDIQKFCSSSIDQIHSDGISRDRGDSTFLIERMVFAELEEAPAGDRRIQRERTDLCPHRCWTREVSCSVCDRVLPHVLFVVCYHGTHGDFCH